MQCDAPCQVDIFCGHLLCGICITDFHRGQSGFELYTLIVVKVNIFIHKLFGFVKGLRLCSVNAFCLQHAEEVFGAGVVIGTTDRRHRRFYAVGFGNVVVSLLSVLKPVVTVQDKPSVGLGVFYCRPNRFDHQTCRHLRGVSVSNNAVVIQILDH